jgi:hypothetical protein
LPPEKPVAAGLQARRIRLVVKVDELAVRGKRLEPMRESGLTSTATSKTAPAMQDTNFFSS